jgi:hypothetical protein
MYLLRCLATFGIIYMACYTHAGSIGTLEHTRLRGIKSENRLIMSWRLTSSDSNAQQVEIFDEQGQPITSLHVLRCVPEAGTVGIYDVSARRGGMIAVAAVYRKAGTRHVRPVPTLLLFDFNGRLSSAFALEPSREIYKIEVDEKLNVWTITSHADNKDPSTVPMVVEYNSNGIVSRELLTRDNFPFHAKWTQTGPSIGNAFMGYDSIGLWFWLPGSTELVTISAEDGRSAIVKTGLPEHHGRGLTAQLRNDGVGSIDALQHTRVLVSIVRDASGKIVGQLGDVGENGAARISNYTWSPITGWSPLELDSCDGDRLIGASEKGLLYLQYQVASAADRVSVCVSQVR